MFGLYAGENSMEYARAHALERFQKTSDPATKVFNKLSTFICDNLLPLCYQYVKSI